MQLQMPGNPVYRQRNPVSELRGSWLQHASLSPGIGRNSVPVLFCRHQGLPKIDLDRQCGGLWIARLKLDFRHVEKMCFGVSRYHQPDGEQQRASQIPEILETRSVSVVRWSQHGHCAYSL